MAGDNVEANLRQASRLLADYLMRRSNEAWPLKA